MTLALRSEPTEMIATVTNFGPEISTESMRAIFDPLVQLPVSSDQKGPATTSLGLCIFIAREITLAHGGSIGVTSDATNGTVFTIRLSKSIDLRGERLRVR